MNLFGFSLIFRFSYGLSKKEICKNASILVFNSVTKTFSYPDNFKSKSGYNLVKSWPLEFVEEARICKLLSLEVAVLAWPGIETIVIEFLQLGSGVGYILFWHMLVDFIFANNRFMRCLMCYIFINQNTLFLFPLFSSLFSYYLAFTASWSPSHFCFSQTWTQWCLLAASL